MVQQPGWKTVWQFLKNLNTELPHDPVIPLLGIYPQESTARTWMGICTLVFIAALFKIARKWKQPTSVDIYFLLELASPCNSQFNTCVPHLPTFHLSGLCLPCSLGHPSPSDVQHVAWAP